MAKAAEREVSYEEPADLPDPDAEEENLSAAEDDELDGELEIEIISDVPVEDARAAARPAADRVDPDDESLEDEVKDYSERAQKRFKEMKFEYHEQRRARESAERQREEAVRYAEQVGRDNAMLKQSLAASSKTVAEATTARTDAELERARREFKQAYEDGDTDALMAAQEKLSQVQLERARFASNTARPTEETNAPQQPRPPQRQAAPQPRGDQPPDARAIQWLRANPWFQQPGNEDMTGYAEGLHRKLISQGYDPRQHEEYYTTIDKQMRSVFKEKFSGGTSVGDEDPPRGASAATTEKKRPPQVGGPSRGGRPPRKVQLTDTQVALAKRLGLTNKEYAAQVVKDQNADV